MMRDAGASLICCADANLREAYRVGLAGFATHFSFLMKSLVLLGPLRQ